ncbi:TIGR02206 family membrane protein [Radiobacillus deserti]|uniref:TIGR02206 family membrane protein n=2 Tax=Radiobacillus deserti TaxID=2594883 RepID=A0A516KL56_9BACI|nr:TIGR02206 family membrane protein [Radiobacillus deserti]
MLALYFIGILWMIMLRKELKLPSTLSQTIRWSFFILLILSEFTYQWWAAVNDVWNLQEHMPLHLCGVASITGMLSLLTYNKRLVRFTFFIGIIPAFLALITPELYYGYDHYRFWKFFIHHIVISWTGLYLILSSSIRITLRSVIQSFMYLVFYACVIGFIINPLLDSNYLYLSNKPTASTPLDLLGSGFSYYINLGLVALTVFLLLYGCYRFFQKKTKAS